MMRDGIRALLSLNNDIKIVGEASEGRETIEKAAELMPDVVVMDIAMPEMDGLEATRCIVKKSPETKVLVLTQHDNKEYVLSAIKAGAAGYVPKKALGSELVSAIRSVYCGDSYLYPSAAAAVVATARNYLKTGAEEPYDRLTDRERQILRLIAAGHPSLEISAMLLISKKTVLAHCAKIMKKLEIHNRADLIKYAMRKGLVSMDT
ncbi:MAG: hypothetical protein A2144_14115 [Chloroflexi bacterium RBG_16_50_9]|nr:MAG: hypothetical protein A2144_14115 [Chloroflexi bacterium RBG_16_50_9]